MAVLDSVRGSDVRRVEGPAQHVALLGAWAGLAFAVAFIAYVVIGAATGPRFEDAASVWQAYAATNAANIRIGAVVIGLGALLFLLPFASAMSRLVAATDEVGEWLARLQIPVVSIVIAALLLSTVVGVAISLPSSGTVPAEAFAVARGVDTMLILWVAHLGTGLWLASLSLAFLRGSSLPRWLGWLGLVLVVPQLLAVSWILTGEPTQFNDAMGGIGQIGAFAVWIPLVSIAVLRGPRPGIAAQVG